ncbi:MAG: hypothetical protein ERJ69_00585 [Aphanocapsa feldmannii 288cV]|nr:MAG: hypothetical protein ERJ69_00585 [Aphanocapsa feldmannii 288cV]
MPITHTLGKHLQLVLIGAIQLSGGVPADQAATDQLQEQLTCVTAQRCQHSLITLLIQEIVEAALVVDPLRLRLQQWLRAEHTR